MDSGWVRKNTYATTSSSSGASSWGQVTPLPFFGSDEDLVEALRKGHPGAAKAFYDRYADVIDRVLSRLVGADDDGLPEMIQDAVLRAIAGIGRLRDPGRLPVWVATAAVTTARAHLRRRGRAPNTATAQTRADDSSRGRTADALTRAMHAVYDVFATMPVEERIVLALRVVDAMPLAEIAEVNRISIGQLKRRLRRAEARFVAAARGMAVLRPWLERGTRWTLPILG